MVKIRRRRDSTTRIAACESWLRHVLADGELPANVVVEAGEIAGFHKRMVERARYNVGAVSLRSGFGPGGMWVWRLEWRAESQRARGQYVQRRHKPSPVDPPAPRPQVAGDADTYCPTCVRRATYPLADLPRPCGVDGCSGVLRLPPPDEWHVVEEPEPDEAPDDVVVPRGTFFYCGTCGRAQMLSGTCLAWPRCRGTAR